MIVFGKEGVIKMLRKKFKNGFKIIKLMEKIKDNLKMKVFVGKLMF